MATPITRVDLEGLPWDQRTMRTYYDPSIVVTDGERASRLIEYMQERGMRMSINLDTVIGALSEAPKDTRQSSRGRKTPTLRVRLMGVDELVSIDTLANALHERLGDADQYRLGVRVSWDEAARVDQDQTGVQSGILVHLADGKVKNVAAAFNRHLRKALRERGLNFSSAHTNEVTGSFTITRVYREAAQD